MGVDHAGAFEALLKPELASRLAVGEAPITRGFGGKQIPWFYMAVPRNFAMDSGLRFWIMEYHPHFLTEWNGRSGNENAGVSRKQILERYAEVLKESPRKPYLKDVVGIAIAVNDSTKRDLVDLCKLVGYRSREVGSTTILSGEDIELQLVPQTATARGIQQITMRVDRKPPRQTEFSFGEKSILKFYGNGLATWSF